MLPVRAPGELQDQGLGGTFDFTPNREKKDTLL